MSGNHITEKQVRLYMKFRKDFTQQVAASKADISVSSARRIENGRHQPNKLQRQWRTRSDPLEAVWESVVATLSGAEGWKDIKQFGDSKLEG